MRVVVFGPTGGTGRHVVQGALTEGHHVVAVARRPGALDIRHERLDVVAGDVHEPSTFAEAIAGADVVVSALGIGYSRAATTVYSAGTANIMRAMRASGVQRLHCVSTASLEPPPAMTAPVQWLVFRGLLHQMLKRPYADMAEMEDRVRRSELDWTVVRAARLTNGARKGRFRVALNEKLRGGWSISRADLADYIVKGLDDRTSCRTMVEIAY